MTDTDTGKLSPELLTRGNIGPALSLIYERQQEAQRLALNLEMWDMAIGCRMCGQAWWGGTYTPKVEDFHDDACLLKGRRDVHEASGLISYSYLDAHCPDDHRLPTARNEDCQ